MTPCLRSSLFTFTHWHTPSPFGFVLDSVYVKEPGVKKRENMAWRSVPRGWVFGAWAYSTRRAVVYKRGPVQPRGSYIYKQEPGPFSVASLSFLSCTSRFLDFTQKTKTDDKNKSAEFQVP